MINSDYPFGIFKLLVLQPIGKSLEINENIMSANHGVVRYHMTQYLRAYN